MAPPLPRHLVPYVRAGLVLAALGAAGGVLLAAAGAYNVGASSGHWAATELLLRFGLWRSVAVRAPAGPPADLGDADRVRLGAGHFDQGCAPCHGAPGRPPDPVTRTMLPVPPALHGSSLGWSDGELYWIVRHGIKYTGMPAWPDPRRGDEPWSVVALLRRLPDLDAAGYRDLAGGRSDGGPAAACAGCHGDAGRPPPSALVPRLHGQKEAVLARALAAYADGGRASGVMRLAAASLPPGRRAALAAHYASLAPLPPFPPPPGAAARIAAGERLARAGDAARRIPPCLACHGGGGRPDYPILDGQSAPYLEQRLRLWQAASGPAEETPWATVMAPIARRLGDADIAAVAAFFSTRGAVAEAAPSGGAP